MADWDFADYAGTFGRLDSDSHTFHQLDRYYRGAQPLRFLHPSLRESVGAAVARFVVNIPRKVVDSLEDRLDVEGFRLRGEDEALSDLWELWQSNCLDSWSQQAHLAALTHGRAFALVGQDPDDMSTPLITVESSAQVSVRWDARRRRITQAVKRYEDDGTTFGTFYGLDSTWQMQVETAALARATSRTNRAPWQSRAEPIQNVLGVVPVVAFVNRPDLLRPFGESEMTDVLGLSDAINKLCVDMILTSESHAAPRRWATGIDLGGSDAEAERTTEKIRQRWEQAEASRTWISDTVATKFGQFEGAPLSNFVTAIDALTSKAAALGNLPPHYIGHTTANPASADAIRSAEAPLVKQAHRKMRGFGESWESIMRLAVLVRDGEVDPAMRSLETIWRDPETPTVAQKADAAVKLLGAGAITRRQVREDIGYTPVQIERMEREDDDAALGPVGAQLDEAARLQRDDGLSQQAAYAAVGLLQAAQAMGQPVP